MKTSITYREYREEVKEIAANVVAAAVEKLPSEYDREELLKLIRDYVIHEHIDGHRYAIYYSYRLPILQYSDNAEYAADIFGGDMLEKALKKGLKNLHATLAYWAFYADVYDAIEML